MFKKLVIFSLLIFNFVNGQNFEFIQSNDVESSKRKIINLNKNWIYQIEDEKKQFNVPFWVEEEKIKIENKFQIKNENPYSIYYLKFEGVRGLTEVYFNEERIPFDPIEVEEYYFRIPSNIVRENRDNFLRIVLSRKFRIQEQNILASRIELPERKIGLYKDVYLEILPIFSIVNYRTSSEIEKNLLTGKINYKIELGSAIQIHPDSAQKLTLILDLIDRFNSNIVSSLTQDVLFTGNSRTVTGSFTIKNPYLWDVKDPNYYTLRIQLYNSNELIDQVFSNIGFRLIELKGNVFYLNNSPLTLKGLTYFETNGVKNSFFRLKDYDRDIKIIKDLGANAILVRNSFPSDELMMKCEENGILVFIDLDNKNYPARLYPRSENNRKLENIANHYSNYACFSGLNFGLVNKESDKKLLEELLDSFNQNNLNVVKFFETDNLKINNSGNFDFVGYNLMHKKFEEVEKFSLNVNGDKFLLVTAFGYNHGLEEEEGYTNPYSVQAQAKYLSAVIKSLKEKNISFFVHTFADYRLPYKSIIAGKLDNTLMKTGLVNEYRDVKKLSYQVVNSYFTDSKLPLIMQGNYTENANIIYVIAGLIFLTSTILSINLTSRYKENVSRALLKSYNFFSDIRDGWFVSSFHSVILALNIAFSFGLVYSGLLFYWKDKIEFERIISLFNSLILFEFSSFLAWRPISSILYFSLIVLIWFFIIASIVRFFNIFVKNKIFMNQAFLIVTWSAIPFLLLLPLGMIIFKILSIENYNFLIYSLIILFHLWILFRTLKGISIVFEVKKVKVYLISFSLIIIILATLVLYLQINFSSIDYLMEFFG